MTSRGCAGLGNQQSSLPRLVTSALANALGPLLVSEWL